MLTKHNAISRWETNCSSVPSINERSIAIGEALSATEGASDRPRCARSAGCSRDYANIDFGCSVLAWPVMSPPISLLLGGIEYTKHSYREVARYGWQAMLPGSTPPPTSLACIPLLAHRQSHAIDRFPRFLVSQNGWLLMVSALVRKPSGNVALRTLTNIDFLSLDLER
jgi:hypothetical protein